MPDEEEYAVQSFTISMRVKKHPKPDELNEPEWEFSPTGEKVGPTDCILMCTRGIEWCVLGQAIARQKAAQSKVIVPVGGGRGKVLRVQ